MTDYQQQAEALVARWLEDRGFGAVLTHGAAVDNIDLDDLRERFARALQRAAEQGAKEERDRLEAAVKAQLDGASHGEDCDCSIGCDDPAHQDAGECPQDCETCSCALGAIYMALRHRPDRAPQEGSR